MMRFLRVGLGFFGFLNAFTFVWAGSLPTEVVHHDLRVRLNPASQTLEVMDTLSTQGGVKGFLLHDELAPELVAAPEGVSLVAGPLEQEKDPPIRKYALKINRAKTANNSQTYPATITLRYAGKINHPLSTPEEEYARGFSDTPGIISEEGVYLAGATYWVPRLGQELVTFSMEVEITSGWDTVSQGARTLHDRTAQMTRARWETAQTQDEIYLIGAQFTEYQKTLGASSSAVEAMAFLRTPDPELANKYLTATGQYLEMYQQLLGPYAYGKFALVENFWETGYGMPSFTLLGPKIIRFPFIINSSYPHEILHNWWGNGVLVQYSSGNWCEGITAYLADHLLKEQQGGGAEYRRTTLQKYVDFVSEKNDIPLTQFIDRRSSASEAIGYGKALMFYHMLRVKFGDEVFKKAFQRFYRDQLYKRATYTDIQHAFEAETGKDLSADFTQWVTQVGAPEIKIGEAKAEKTWCGKDRIVFTLEQTQSGGAYDVQVPVAISLVGQKQAYQTQVRLNSKKQEFALELKGQPYFLEVDPEYDVFRRPDRFEIPPSHSQALGAKKALILIASEGSAVAREAYRRMAAIWRDSNGAEAVDIKMDNEVSELPSDRAIWLMGPVKKFDVVMNDALKELNFTVSSDSIRVGKAEFPRVNHSFSVAARHPSNPSQVIVWVSAGVDEAIAGLSRKLPHYGKYSYLVFEGTEPKAVSQGIWPSLHSPMSVAVKQAGGTILDQPKAKLGPRAALVEIPPLFSSARMKDSIQVLTDERVKGRELGTPELDQVGDYLVSEWQKMGLQVSEQVYEASGLPAPHEKAKVRNVMAIIPGKNATLTEPVVLGAHYDHLGIGYPDSHAADRGKIHPGADDNASGVAVMLELSRYYAEQAKSGLLPERTLIFVGFSAEESGLLGSQYFVADLKRRGTRAFAMVNLDTVGRLGANKLMVFGTGSASEFQGMMMGIGYVSGVPLQPIPNDIGSSDQKSFIDAGMPGIHLFSGGNTDYHRASDTPDKLDYAGMVKVASVTKEALDYLSNRKEPLTGIQGGGGGGGGGGGARKVYLGTMPDFAFAGPGVRVASVTADSPASKAGLIEGDVIVRMNETEIIDLKGYSAFLKTLKGGDVVKIGFERAGVKQETKATVIER